MENNNNEFYKPENQAEFAEYDELVDTLDGDDVEFDDDDDDAVEFDDDDDAFEFDDDDDDSEFDDDDDDSEGEDAEFLGGIARAALPFIAPGIGGAIKGVSGLLRRRRRRPRRLRSRRYTSGGPKVARNVATAGRSNLSGRIRTRSGKSIRFKLPPNVATKRDVLSLKKGISTNAKAIRSVTKGVKANAKSIVSTSRQISSIDKKHTSASQTQNRILNSLNKRVRHVKKELDSAEERQKMMQMFQFMMPPEIEKMTFETAPTADTSVDVKEVEFKTNLLPMMMAMGSGGSGSGGMMDNPMMMFMMMDGLK